MYLVALILYLAVLYIFFSPCLPTLATVTDFLASFFFLLYSTLFAEVGSSARRYILGNVAVAPATYLSCDTRFVPLQRYLYIYR